MKTKIVSVSAIESLEHLCRVYVCKKKKEIRRYYYKEKIGIFSLLPGEHFWLIKFNRKYEHFEVQKTLHWPH